MLPWLQPFPADPVLVAAGVAGFAALGSFLGAAQARLGATLDGEATYGGASFWRGRSICPACRQGLPVRDLVPIVSWIALGRRCRHCGVPIPTDYAAVEAGSVLVFVLALWLGGPWPSVLGRALLGAVLVALVAVDLRRLLLPDGLVLPLLPLGLLEAWLAGGDLVVASAGAVFGGGLLWLVRAVHKRVRGREGLGLGDVKLMAAGGAWVGPAGIGPVLLVAALATLTAIGVAYLLGRGPTTASRIPFGPGLALGIFAVTLFA
ncbi:MAG: prepilin peptidase [Alphaproteobacteria bacterium]|nr:prepilin peptidase [Alphaproteobacteria bacterium]